MVEVSIRKTDRKIIFEIEDNGVGFDLKKKRKGIGLRNMRSRSKQIGADFDIQSEHEKGTKLTITIQTKTIYHDPEIQGSDH